VDIPEVDEDKASKNSFKKVCYVDDINESSAMNSTLGNARKSMPPQLNENL
jgi:hypothetical protein